MAHPFSDTTMGVLHELDLGQHTLLLMSDGSSDLLAHDEQTACRLVVSRVCLDSDETYRLFISLQEQFQPQRKEETEKKR
jgi:hypothetical protein